MTTQTVTKLSPTTPKFVTPKKIVKHYDKRWLNKELEVQIELLLTTNTIYSQIQMYMNLPYSRSKFNYWVGLNGNTPRTQDLLKKRDEILEAKLVDKGFSGNNPAFAIFLLKNNYNYQDKREVESNNNYTFNVSRGLTAPLRKQIASKSTTKPQP